MNRSRYLAQLTWPDIDALDKDEGVVILPIGAVEQHGPHLPTLTDTLIVSTGVRPSYFGHDEWKTHAPGLKTVEDATRIRSKIPRLHLS